MFGADHVIGQQHVLVCGLQTADDLQEFVGMFSDIADELFGFALRGLYANGGVSLQRFFVRQKARTIRKYAVKITCRVCDM